MPRKKTSTGWTKVLMIRISEQQDKDLRIAAEALGLDLSNLVRLIFTEHLPEYMARGEGAARRAADARAKAVKEASDADAKPTDSDGEPTRNLEV
jgi:hypothetical protein